MAAQVIEFPAAPRGASLQRSTARLGGLRAMTRQDPRAAAAARRARDAAAAPAAALPPRGGAGGPRDRRVAALGAGRGRCASCSTPRRPAATQATIRMRRRAPGCRPARPSTPGTRRPPRSPPPTQHALTHPGMDRPRREALSSAGPRHRQEPPRRSARAPRDRPGQDRRLAHPGIPRRRCCAATAPTTPSPKRSAG